MCTLHDDYDRVFCATTDFKMAEGDLSISHRHHADVIGWGRRMGRSSQWRERVSEKNEYIVSMTWATPINESFYQ